MGRSGSPSPGAHPQHPASVHRYLLNPHGWQSVTQGRSSAASGACSSNKRVNLIRSRSGFDPSSQTAHRLRAVR
jgi:hypothetical protein